MRLKTADLITPYFVIEGRNKRVAISHFPGVERLSIDRLLKEVGNSRKLGLNKVLLFGVPSAKDPLGRGAYEGEPLVSRAVRTLKREFPKLVVMTDVCLCAYTSHGHCGVLAGKKNSSAVVIDGNKTLASLAAMAVSHALAGADWVAPSAMAAGQVKAIRLALDTNGLDRVKILGYSAKFASSFYGPFRSAAQSTPAFGDRRGYQLPWEDAGLALKKIKDDIAQGADMVMVKPALAYLDIIRLAKERFGVRMAAYNVSGEYALVAYGAKAGACDRRNMVMEIMAAIKRAGADEIITYHAREVAGWL